MAEPASSSAALTITAAGLTIFGISTGLHPPILLAGLAGGLWSLSYQPPLPAWRRLAVATLASIIAGYLTPAVAVGITSIAVWPPAMSNDLMQLPIAVTIGLLAHRVLGPAVMRFAAKKAEEVQK